MSTKAQIFQTLLAGLYFGGVPASGYVAYFVTPGTAPAITSLKTIYLDSNKTTPAANPYTLDSDGRAELFLDGNYDVIIKTAVGGTVKATWENVLVATDVLSGLNVDARDATAGDVNVSVVAANDPDAVVRTIGKRISDVSANSVIITPTGGTISGLASWPINTSGTYIQITPIPADNDYLVK